MQQGCVNQAVEITVEYGIDVPHLIVAAVIFDALLGMQGVGTDLAAKADLTLFARQLGKLAGLLLSLALEQM